MSVDTALERLRAANPVPDPAMLAAQSNETPVLLPVTWQRSIDMTDTIERPRTEEPPSPKRQPAFIAAIAAGIVIIAGLAAVVLSTTGTDNQVPATDVPVTEAPDALAPFTGDDAVAAAEDVIAMFNAGDTEGVAGALAAATGVQFGPDSEYDDMWATGLDEFVAVHEGLAAVGTTFNFEIGSETLSFLLTSGAGCEHVAAASAPTVACRGSLSGALFEAPDETPKDGFVSVEFTDDGTITRFSMRFITQDGSIRDLINGLVAYVGDTHPEELNSISVVSAGAPNTVFARRLIVNAETAPQIVELIKEWTGTLP